MAWFAAAKGGAEAKVMSVSRSLHVLADSGAALQRRRNMQGNQEKNKVNLQGVGMLGSVLP